MKASVLKYFEKKIFEQYGQSIQFEKCRKYLLNVLDTMNEQIDWFNTLSNEKKYKICETAALIAIQSERESINKFSIVTQNQELDTEHGINRKNPKYDLKQFDIISSSKEISYKQ